MLRQEEVDLKCFVDWCNGTSHSPFFDERSREVVSPGAEDRLPRLICKPVYELAVTAGFPDDREALRIAIGVVSSQTYANAEQCAAARLCIDERIGIPVAMAMLEAGRKRPARRSGTGSGK